MTSSIMMATMTRPDQTVNYDLLYDKEYHSQSFTINHFLSKKLSFKVIKNGYILPFRPSLPRNGVFDSDGNYIEDTGFGRDAVGNGTEQSLQEMSIEHNHSTVIYLGAMLSIWGHCLTDNISRMWFLRTENYRDNFSQLPMAYIPTFNFKIEGNYKQLLEILDINLSTMLPISKPVKYDRIIIPDKCFFGFYFTQEYRDIINTIRDFAISHSKTPLQAKKIYFSYSKYKDTKSVGEDKLEKYFASKGYEIIYPERLSLNEELNILANCESFASTDGSCAHNSLFLRDNAEVILIPRASYLTGYQLAINHVHKHNVHYIDSSFSIFVGETQYAGPFLYYVSSNLRKYFQDEDTKCICCLSDFLKYILSALGLRFSREFGNVADGNNTKVYRYYASIAAEYFGSILDKQKLSWPFRFRQFVRKIRHRKW